MKLSSQEEYGLRCLLQLARHGDEASLTIAEMSQREGISSPNVAKIMRILRRAGLVASTRGKAGGYTLARPPTTSPSVSTCWAPWAAASSTRGFCDAPRRRRALVPEHRATARSGPCCATSRTRSTRCSGN